jgi:hypothetical protein
MIEAERSSRVQEPDSAPVTQPGWRVPSYHDRGDFSLPDWCDERSSKPTPSDPGSCALRAELIRRRFRVPRSGRCTGSPAPVAHPVCVGYPAVENGVCHPFRREGMRASMSR